MSDVVSEDSQLSQKRVAKNTIWLYLRMLISLPLSFYSSRLLLQLLGVEDFGIYNVVGGIVAMFSILSSSMSMSVTRFMTFELGRKNLERLKYVFSTAICVHVIIAIVSCVALEVIGVWFLNTKMQIPPERLWAANWVFQFSVIIFTVGIASTPFSSAIVAHERFTIFAVLGLLNVVLKFLVILLLVITRTSMDKLVLYAFFILVVSLLLNIMTWVYCGKTFDEVRLTPSIDKSLLREMGSLSGWNIVANGSILLKDRGIDILLNLFFGPVVNAARGLATTVNGVIQGFAGNLMASINPQITKSYAIGDMNMMFSLVERASRFSFYVIMFLSLPVILETPFALKLWLGEYPEHTVSLVRLTLFLSLIDITSSSLYTVQQSTGQMKTYILRVQTAMLFLVPTAYVALKFGSISPEITYVIIILFSFIGILLHLGVLNTCVGMPINFYFKRILINVVIVFTLSAIPPILVSTMMPNEGFVRFVIVSFVSLVSSSFCILYIGCSQNERSFIFNQISQRIMQKYINRS